MVFNGIHELHGKRDFADVIMDANQFDFKIGSVSWIIQVSLWKSHEPLELSCRPRPPPPAEGRRESKK
jgi:hypothetical protein